MAHQTSQPTTEAAPDARLATRLAFLVAGFAMACCAPLFPFFKTNVGVDTAGFGVLLLCLGIGSIIAMPVTGILAARRGAKPLILLGGFGLVALLPLLPMAQSPAALGAGLFLFGASLGTIDVAMNVHGAEVEALEQRPLMSNFHAHFSIGGVLGAGMVTLLLSLSVSPAHCAILGALLALIAHMLSMPRFLRVSGKPPEPLAFPRGIVLLLSVLAAVTFLVEGAVLDWGALVVIDRNLFSAEQAGAGYILFSIAMVVARLTGDNIILQIGEYWVLVVGGITAAAGIAIVLSVSAPAAALFGFALIGLGAANLVPILFSAAGRQKLMPPGVAIASVTTTGYAGILLGPALIGYVAGQTTLVTAFWLIAALMLLLPLTARWVIRA